MSTDTRFRGRFGLWMMGCLLAVVFPLSAWAGPTACDRGVTPEHDLQATLEQLPDDGSRQVLCLGAGEFQLDGMVTVTRNNTVLRGEGRDKTVLRMKAGVSSPVLVLGDAIHQQPSHAIKNVQVESMAIRGGGDSDSEFFADMPYLSNSALIVRQGDGVVLRDLDVRDCRSACVLTEYHSRDVRIENNHISHAQWDGVSLNRAGPTALVGNTIRDNVAAGLTVEYLQSSEIRDNVITGNGSHGMYLADAEHNEFSNNRIEDNGMAGVFLTCSVRERDPVLCWDNSFSRDNTFTDNHFRQNRFGYQIAVDSAANCLGRETPPNVSRGDTFKNSPNEEPAWDKFGRCIAFEGSKTL
ncbi:right-handed parallel beta-helix repeat-containing protein [Marinobacter sp. 1Y8]